MQTATRQRIGGQLVSSSATTYTPTGQVATSTDRFGHVSTSRYDVRGQLVESRTPTTDENDDPVTLVTRTAYDNLGRAVASTDPFIENVTPLADVRVTHTIYDVLGRVSETRRVGIASNRYSPIFHDRWGARLRSCMALEYSRRYVAVRERGGITWSSICPLFRATLSEIVASYGYRARRTSNRQLECPYHCRWAVEVGGCGASGL